MVCITPATPVKKYFYCVLGASALAAITDRFLSIKNRITLLAIGIPLLGLRECNNLPTAKNKLKKALNLVTKALHSHNALQIILGSYFKTPQRTAEGIKLSVITSILYAFLIYMR
jgi:hypothetical protein